ncbi:MAG: histidinol dehydrogenase [Chloroflexota bacterium]|nr:histidinol dehydrogenase [Chloroflexota bacterium]
MTTIKTPGLATRPLRTVRLKDLDVAARKAIVQRSTTAAPELRDRVRAIVDDVRQGGDEALRDANGRFGGGLPADSQGPAPLTLDRATLRAACDALPPALRDALSQMASNIGRFHAAQVPPPEQWVDIGPGIRVGRVWRPLDRVAAYVPGGTAAYPSSLLMSAIPARLAGVREFVVASPAGRDGTLSPALLGAAGLLEVDEFVVAGGAQAIAALANGTESVRAVDKIVGPGNAWVTAAKLEVFGQVAIDMPAGPSEVMVVADDTADPAHVAADLLSQAEHGADSPAILVTTSARLADQVTEAVIRQLPTLPRQAELQASLASAGLIVETETLDEAFLFVNEYAPEHLSVVVADLDAAEAVIRHAGSLFLGPYAPESAGDYATGSNHVLPTGRLARSYGALSVEAFGKWLQVQRVTREGLASVRDTVAAVAEAEGLTAHRRAVDIRFESEASES